MFTLLLYLLALGGLLISFWKDRHKTQLALMKGWKAFTNILPDFAVVLALIGIMLTYLSPHTIAALLGKNSGFPGILASSIAGSITLIPGFVAFPLAKSLLDRGAGIMQIAVFVSTLMMVGVVTAPLESRYFGRRETILRNSLSYIFSFIVAMIIGMVVGA
ncbi:permease [Moorella sp. E308F]|uniref:permease n=1 Tax=Moorella sp. E308F TaxID=2572682 RepID=UPI0010FFB25E|nr:permease [Moorella sp. E308F]GEA14110.1 permease [Moorella sp. E308F]